MAYSAPFSVQPETGPGWVGLKGDAMNSSINAIETEYKGYRFRSRLEARWAAFFDIVGWPWQYEPFDTNGWIPDFLLGESILVEIKPYTRLEEFSEAIKKAWMGIENTALDDKDLLLLGVGFFKGQWNASLGWIGENFGHFDSYDIIVSEDSDATPWNWEEASFVREGDRYDFCQAESSYRGRIIGLENDSGGSFVDGNDMQLQKAWGRAHHLTRWKPQ